MFRGLYFSQWTRFTRYTYVCSYLFLLLQDFYLKYTYFCIDLYTNVSAFSFKRIEKLTSDNAKKEITRYFYYFSTSVLYGR